MRIHSTSKNSSSEAKSGISRSSCRERTTLTAASTANGRKRPPPMIRHVSDLTWRFPAAMENTIKRSESSVTLHEKVSRRISKNSLEVPPPTPMGILIKHQRFNYGSGSDESLSGEEEESVFELEGGKTTPPTPPTAIYPAIDPPLTGGMRFVFYVYKFASKDFGCLVFT